MTKPRILVIGAHPDDCEIKCGGTAALWAANGFTVRFVSATNGCSGHHEIGGVELVRRRVEEAAAAAAVIGIESLVMDAEDGALEPTLPRRKAIIAMIREFKPDLILTHRPNDYHPDHRYTSQLVQDSAYMVTVPNIVPQVPVLRANPVIAYLSDDFQKPIPFQADIVVPIDDVIEKKIDMQHCHVSQFYEWLPWNQQCERDVPKNDRERREWLKTQWLPMDVACAEKYRVVAKERCGQKIASKMKYAEAFELCEYGGRMTYAKMKSLFPFLY